ncbi:MAG: glycosyltransferase family 4 protein [Ignavibacterium sp.]|jgi:glycosyltransferase involved in cell wall biosynthesis|nr:glycosyltransferase family 4 protein [Ignavibacterium sp.]
MAGKNILILTNHFYPENFRVNDVAFELAKNNFNVTVLTGIPDYPQGRFYKGYGLFNRRKEIVEGVKVIRIPLIPRGKDSLFMLSLNYISYAFCLTIWSFFIALFQKFDSILVHHTSPVFLGVPAVMIKKMQKIKLYFWNLDIWPESVTETTGLRLTLIVKILNKIVSFIYRNSNKILISSRAFRQSVISRGIDEKDIIYFPNWAEDVFINNELTNIDLSSYGINKSALKIMYAGNIGEAQDPDNILKAIELVSRSEYSVNWLFVGEGRKFELMKNSIEKMNLKQQVYFLGQHPVEKMPSFFQAADVMFLSLKNKKIFTYTAPAKLQAYMASSKPVLAMISGEGADIIRNAECGLVGEAGDYQSLFQNSLKFAQMNSQQRETLGKNGHDYYKKYFSKEKAMHIITSLVQLTDRD